MRTGFLVADFWVKHQGVDLGCVSSKELKAEDILVSNKSFFCSGGSVLTRIEVQVDDDFESGTDCTVYFALKNQGTTETCQTGPLDGPGDDWAMEERECYSENVYYDLKCKNFQPRFDGPDKLQFKIHLDSSCIDHLQLTWVRVNFGYRYFQWSKATGHWFNPSSNWVNFDFWGIGDDFGDYCWEK